MSGGDHTGKGDETAIPNEADVTAGKKENEEPTMIDVHAPHESVHSWKDFFLHIAIITIGLLIAIGLEQAVVYIEHCHEVAATREALRIEREINANRFAVETEELHRYVPMLKTDLAIFEYLKKHPGAPPDTWPGKLNWTNVSFTYEDAEWKTAQASNVLQYMLQAEVRRYSQLYGRLEYLNDLSKEKSIAFGDAGRYHIEDPDPMHFTPAQIDRQIDLTSQVLLEFATQATAQRNLNHHYSDFTPYPTADDIAAISNSPAPSSEDLQATNSEVAKVYQFDASHGSGNEAAIPGEAGPNPNWK
jgi:hypothetical protein